MWQRELLLGFLLTFLCCPWGSLQQSQERSTTLSALSVPPAAEQSCRVTLVVNGGVRWDQLIQDLLLVTFVCILVYRVWMLRVGRAAARQLPLEHGQSPITYRPVDAPGSTLLRQQSGTLSKEVDMSNSLQKVHLANENNTAHLPAQDQQAMTSQKFNGLPTHSKVLYTEQGAYIVLEQPDLDTDANNIPEQQIASDNTQPLAQAALYGKSDATDSSSDQSMASNAMEELEELFYSFSSSNISLEVSTV